MSRALHTSPSRAETIILAAVNAHWRSNCVPPTVREIIASSRLGISTSMVSFHLQALERLGYLEMRLGKPVPRWVIKQLEVIGE